MAFDLTSPPDPGLAPGEARCPGPSMQDILARDGGEVPAALKTSAYEFLGDADLGFERVTSQAFFDAEIDKVWSRTWQWACREEQIPQVGDYTVYDVGPYSVLVIRSAATTIKAFVNSCPHRGMQFCDSNSQGSGKQFIRCPFHGMTWHLDGSLREIPCRWDFPHIDEQSFGLIEVHSDTWGGFVFINLDDNAEPLADYLGVLPEHFKDWKLEDRYIAQHTYKILPANWKTAMEAFLEAYHVLATHPEGLHTTGDANAQYDIFGKHVSRFVHAFGAPSPHLPREQTEAELFGHLGRDSEQLPAGSNARVEHARLLREELSVEYGTDLSAVPTSIMLDSIEYFVFPNAFFFPGINIPLIYRFRPLDVDHCVHEVLVLQPVPDAQPRPRPADVIKLGIDDSYTSVPDFDLGFLLDQDTENFKRQRAGIKASRKRAQTLGNYQEARIRHLHATLDEYLRS